MQKIPIIILLFFLTEMKAQTEISLDFAIETALKNNLLIKNEHLKSEYSQLLIKTAKNIPSTMINGEFGQINSAYFDNRFSVSQSFALPTVYQKQKQLLTEEWKTAALGITIKEAELKKAVSETFYYLLFLNEKQQLLLKNDTIYTVFLAKAAMRLAKGESNILEKTSAETQQGNLRLQLKQLQQEKDLMQIQLQLLLNAETKFEPKATSFKLIFNENEANSIAKNPLLQLLQQQKQVNMANIEVEKSKLLPEFNVGYSSMTMRGVGSNDVRYNGITRFHSAQIGVGIPLFKNAQRSKIEAATFYEKVLDNEFQTEKLHLSSQFQNALLQHQKLTESIAYFEQKALPNVDLIEKTATKQFQNGEINYLEWAILINQSIGVKSEYLDNIRAFNDNIILINYLINK